MRTTLTAALTVFVAISAGCGQPMSPNSPSSVLAGGRAVVDSTADPGAVQAAAVHTVPFKGRLDGVGVITFEPPPSPFFAVSLTASGNATHLGGFTLVAPHTVDTRNGTASGTFAFTAANGDTVTGSFTGASAPTPNPDVFAIVETATILDGTGRFDGASGSFTVERQVNLATGLTSGSFEGRITSPGANRQ